MEAIEMTYVDCPWCEAEQPCALAQPETAEPTFHCHECGTTVLWRDESEASLDLAA
jgi:uncharacterized Zn finger protein